MLGVPTLLLIADRVWSEADQGKSLSISTDNKQWFMLGAVGPTIGDFVPNEKSNILGVQGRTPYYAIWRLVFQIAVGNPTLALPDPTPTDPNRTTPLPGVVQTLGTLLGILNKVEGLVANRDFDGMKALRDSGQLNVINKASKDLTTILQYFSDTSHLREIANLIRASAPVIDNTSQQVSSNSWTGRDWLHWKQTGTFASELLMEANRSGDPRFIAYAKGWQVSYAALVCGSGFVASAAGSCYRTYWWRNRWISNFVDTWLWGFYQSGSVLGDNNEPIFPDPTQPYANWPSLCNAKLHEWIDLTGGLVDPKTEALKVVLDDPDNHPLARALPKEFTTFWITAWEKVYQPTGDPLFTEDRLQVGYLLTWLVLWFQTSGDVLGCNPAPSPTPPSACGDNPQPPDWVDPNSIDPTTCPSPANPKAVCQTFKAPTPNAYHDPNVGEVVCGAILAALGVASFFLGGGLVGAGAIAGGIGLIVDGEKELNWDELECQLYWLNMYMFNGLSTLHKVAVLGGFQHPYAPDLAISTETIKYGDNLPLSYSSAASTCKSQFLGELFTTWDGALLDWTNYPKGRTIETPRSVVWYAEGLWPSAFVDDINKNPIIASILTSPPAYDSGVEGQFGPAVQNALQILLGRRPVSLPNWNLDGDRGKGWLTWEQTGAYQIPLPTKQEV